MSFERTEKHDQPSSFLSTAVRYASDRIIVIDQQKNILFVNEAAQTLFGPCMIKDGYGVDLAGYICAGHELKAQLSNVLEGNEDSLISQPITISEVPVVGIDGRKRNVSISIVSDIKGTNLTHTLFIKPDSEAERLLKAQLVEVLEHSPEAILLYSQDGVITYVNRHVKNISGFTKSEMIQEHATRFMPRNKFVRLITELEKNSNLKNASCVFELKTSSGAQVPVETLVRKITIGTQSVYVSIIRDVSEALQFEQKMLDEKQSSEEANSATSNFLANMSHEMRTPLNGVLGTLSLIDKSVLDNETTKLISAAENSAETLLGLIDDLLHLHRIEAGEIEIEPSKFQVSELTSIAEEVFGAVALSKDINFNVSSSSQAHYCIGDFGKIRQIMINLIGNAMKFTNQRGLVQVDIDLQLRASVKNLMIKVQDTGIGVSLQDQKTLFERFKQVDSSTTKRHGGAGLGLAISHELAEILGGDITVASAPGVGSTFILKVPVELGSELALQDNSPSADQPKLIGKALIAEDSDTNAMVARMMLTKIGVECDRVVDGAAAVQAAMGESYDVILMDISMPNIDGIEATRILRQRGVAVPIIAMSAHAFKKDKDKGFAVGMSGYITKPIKREAVYSELRKWLPSACSV
ncbi:MAG: ATP-binding protein [Hyphomonas sp.]|nr:ATP-binding protein [Hyphomonas sp.]